MTLTRDQQKAYAKNHYAANKETYAANRVKFRAKRMLALNQIKEDRGACTDCGIKFHPYAMDFDHVRGEKIGDVSDLIQSAAWQKVLDEIEKCDLVCAVCHRIRTYRRIQDAKLNSAIVV